MKAMKTSDLWEQMRAEMSLSIPMFASEYILTTVTTYDTERDTLKLTCPTNYHNQLFLYRTSLRRIATALMGREIRVAIIGPDGDEVQPDVQLVIKEAGPRPAAPRLGKCRSCGAVIEWVRTKNDKWTPQNMDGMSHWATCPSAQKHR